MKNYEGLSTRPYVPLMGEISKFFIGNLKAPKSEVSKQNSMSSPDSSTYKNTD
jgi:hypothetical protein